MQTLKLNVADEMLNKVMTFIEALPKGSVMVQKVEEVDDAQLTDPFFKERKAMIQQRIDDIDSGKLKLRPFEEFEGEMDAFMKELELKYAS